MSAVRNPARDDVAARNGQTDDRHARRLVTETKASFKTTEFIAFVAIVSASSSPPPWSTRPTPVASAPSRRGCT